MRLLLVGLFLLTNCVCANRLIFEFGIEELPDHPECTKNIINFDFERGREGLGSCYRVKFGQEEYKTCSIRGETGLPIPKYFQLLWVEEGKAKKGDSFTAYVFRGMTDEDRPLKFLMIFFDPGATVHEYMGQMAENHKKLLDLYGKPSDGYMKILVDNEKLPVLR